MYKILVVDDEIATIRHICNIISLKCPEFQVMGTAENGKDALDILETEIPDIVITDMRMPVMDGVALLKRIKDRHPEILVVVVSGYQEFEYTKVAIKSGVCDYLLKPISPSALQNILASLKGKLNQMYSEKRNALIKKLCGGGRVEKEELERYFHLSSGLYYAALVRRNGLPGRFSRKTGTEIFSGRDDMIYSYGRDEMESLYLCPENIVVYESFYQIVAGITDKERKKPGSSYVTAVIKETGFKLEKSAEVFKELYEILNQNMIIGQNQILIAEEISRGERETTKEEADLLSEFEGFLNRRDIKKAKQRCGDLFDIWKRTGRSQMYVESQVRYILLLLGRCHLLSETERNCEWILDDLFYNAPDLDKIWDVIGNTLFLDSRREKRGGRVDTPEFFGEIENYIRENLAAPVSIQSLCQKFGISQTYLSKMFRKYMDCSFNKFLTMIRMERAKELMEQERFCYVKDIAANVGFDDQYYFSRLFTSIVGICPSDYMESFVKSLDDK